MGKQQRLKVQRRAERQAAESCLSDGIHFLVPGVPQPGVQEKLTENFQNQIRNSTLWSQMVADFGEEKALELLRQCKAEIQKE